jgi:PhnB protein
MSSHTLPDGVHTITPNIVVKDAKKAVNFYKKAFGAREKTCLTMPDGKIVHCEMAIGDSCFILADEMEGWPAHPLLAQIFVDDCDALFNRAVDAGAKVLSPLSDMFFGIREGRVVDPFGGTWTICTIKENISAEEMQRRINAAAL